MTCSLVICFLSITAWSQPANTQRDEIVLLQSLAEATSSSEASKFDRELQAIWSKSGSSAMDLLLRRGQDALERGEYSLALQHLTALVDHAPTFAEGWHLRAKAFFNAELIGPAISDMEQSLELNPNNYHAIFGLAMILEGIGKNNEAFKGYSVVKKMHPNHENIDDALKRLESQINGISL
ncbi:MAG: hypothetical protein OXC62_12750 [Aestuariivita sp.]|nr:hypothetical protein [Aestuariivita sp.]